MPLPKEAGGSAKSTAGAVVALLQAVWRSHGRLMETSLLYQTVMVVLADTIVAQINVHRLLQVVHEMLINLWVRHRPAY